MNKKIKDEFDNLMNDQTPDLWARIEASLPDKNEIRKTDTESFVPENKKTELEPEGFMPKDKKGNRKKKSGYKKYAAYGTMAAAACLCVFVFASQRNVLKSERNLETAMEETACDTAGEMMMEEADATAFTESDEEGLEESMEYEETMGDAADMAETTEEDIQDLEMAREETEDAVSKENSQAEYDSGVATNGAVEESLANKEQKASEEAVLEKIETLEEQGYFVFEHISICVDRVLETTDGGKDILTYQVTVIQKDGYMEKGKQLELKVDELFQESLTEGENYVITFYDSKLPIESSIHEYFLLKAEKANK